MDFYFVGLDLTNRLFFFNFCWKVFVNICSMRVMSCIYLILLYFQQLIKFCDKYVLGKPSFYSSTYSTFIFSLLLLDTSTKVSLAISCLPSVKCKSNCSVKRFDWKKLKVCVYCQLTLQANSFVIALSWSAGQDVLPLISFTKSYSWKMYRARHITYTLPFENLRDTF
jgi:hypothetical protein